jgi:MFS family permease
VGASFTLEFLYQKIGRKKTFSLGGILMGISSAALIFLTPATKDLMYPVAILAGAA